MSAHPPPVPPDQRSNKGPSTDPASSQAEAHQQGDSRDRNLAEQGRQGNIKQNTTNKGLQHDR